MMKLLSYSPRDRRILLLGSVISIVSIVTGACCPRILTDIIDGIGDRISAGGFTLSDGLVMSSVILLILALVTF